MGEAKIHKDTNIVEAFTLVILLSLFAYVIINWDMIPEQIPSHFNFQGQIDSWSNKNMILFPVLVCLCLYLVLTVASFYPSMWNMPVKITEENRVCAYYYTRNMITILKLELVSVFAYIKRLISDSMAETILILEKR